MAQQLDFTKFNSIQLMMASPEDVREWSHGEVRKPETINYRTYKAERDGLFCERIFGPMRDYECNCGRYKYPRHKGVVCERCGVEVTEKEVRRERMGHIELAVPVAHIWYIHKPPSRIGMLLNLKRSDVERIAYYAAYIVTDVSDPNIKLGGKKLREEQLISIEDYQVLKEEYGSDFEALIGGEALHELLSQVNLKKIAGDIRKNLSASKGGKGQRLRWRRRLKVVEDFLNSGNKPEHMMLSCVPVIPPDLRPLVPLKGGKFASSDLNDLYRRIINRNNRLIQISEMGAPTVMLHNEKRLLQEAVDALIENGARGRVVTGMGNRPLKSLSDSIKGKQGRFRRNLLGKRVDYSGRSVIVIGPSLKLNQCGLPKEMAIELFKPFILRELIHRGVAANIKSARPYLENKSPVVFDILEEIIKDHPVMLNRAPTLHRLGIQAFDPVLIEGKAIQLHPLVCTAFNADFDGDQMAVHVPISPEACIEVKMLVMSTNNIISPSSGQAIVTPTQDMVMGCNYLTKEKKGVLNEGSIFSSMDEAERAYDHGRIDLHARIKVRGVTAIKESDDWTEKELRNPDLWKDYTTVGRVIFNRHLPEAIGFINLEATKKSLSSIVHKCYWEIGKYETIKLLDELKDLGYRYATISDISISIDDMQVPADKQDIIIEAEEKVKKAEANYSRGIITNVERYNAIIEIWSHVTDRIADSMIREIKGRESLKYDASGPKFNPILLMATSGARGSFDQIRQLAGMRGLMSRPHKYVKGAVGEIIESPIKTNFREGLTVLEYFISTHGGRKGLADTALKTADAGYLTRRLVDAAHNLVITEVDCGTVNGVRVGPLKEGNEIIEPFSERIEGRVILQTITDPILDEVLVREGDMIDKASAEKIEKSEISNIRIRSPLTCETGYGICSKCYGADMSTGKLVKPGLAVGIIAAQSIGEPGTQLTLRTFHIGGTASRVAQLSAVISHYDGDLEYVGLNTIKNRRGELINAARKARAVIRKDGKQVYDFDIRYGARIFAKPARKGPVSVKRGELLVEWDPFSMPLITEVNGTVSLKDIKEGITVKREVNQATGREERVIIPYKSPKLHPQIEVTTPEGEKKVYPLPVDTHLVADKGEEVHAGDVLAKIPQEVIKTRDITGGLPRVTELFEARKPKNSAVITEIDGIVKLGTIEKGAFKVTVESEKGQSRSYVIPAGKHLVVYEGDRVYAGEPLTDGPINPHDMLQVKGDKEVQEYLVNEVQGVYRLQGVRINDKHIEMIIKQMLSYVQIADSGDTTLLEKEIVKKTFADRINAQMAEQGKKPATYVSKLLGISKASLSGESFISAASFQETTRILTEAAVSGQIDYLKGLKENVIIGKLIPVGTGIFSGGEE